MAHAVLHAPNPRNIYIIGAQSSGKTTLIAALKLYFEDKSELASRAMTAQKPYILGEVARRVLQDHNSTGKDVSESKSRALELQTLILEAQYEAENAIKDSWFISDRSGVDAIVYGKCYVGESGVEKLLDTIAWKHLEKSLRDSLIIVCEPVDAWLKEDGLRFMPKSRSARTKLVSFIHERFCDFLSTAGFQYVVLPNNLLELGSRVHFVIGEWEKFGEKLG
ncbi:MAG: hypothetical protein Q9187_004618 [Circinaria calcarea]